MNRLSASLLSICVLWLVSGYEPTATSAQQPTFRTGVDLVQLDVIVLDKNRRPVTGLTAADFTIEEDGKPKAIEAFVPITLPPPRITTGASWTRDVAPDVVTNQRAEDGRLVVILMDHSIPVGSMTTVARTIARAAVDALGTQDLAAVVRSSPFTGEGISQNFTADRTLLRSAIDSPFMGLTKSPPSGPSLGEDGIPGGSIACPCGVCQWYAIERIANELSATERRQKTLLFIGRDIVVQEGTPFSRDGYCAVRVRAARTNAMRALDRSNVTVHSIDPGGLETLAATASGASRVQGDSNLYRQGNLAVLPDYTGGRTVLNANQPELFLSDIFAESQSYYLLGFQRGSGGRDDERHQIRVRVNRGDVTVRSRRGYYSTVARSVETTATDRLEESIRPLMPVTDLPLRLALSSSFLPDGSPAVGVLVEIGSGVESSGPEASRRAPALTRREPFDAVVRVFDANGKSVTSVRETLSAPDDVGPHGFEWLSHFGSKPGRYEVRVGVREAGTVAPRTGSIYGYVTVPDLDKEVFALSDVHIETGTTAAASGEQAAGASPTLRRVFARSDVVKAVVQIGQRSNRQDRITLRSRVIDIADRDVAETAAAIDSSRFNDAGVADFRLNVPVAALPSGHYLLAIEATVGGRALRRDVPFEVR